MTLYATSGLVLAADAPFPGRPSVDVAPPWPVVTCRRGRTQPPDRWDTELRSGEEPWLYVAHDGGVVFVRAPGRIDARLEGSSLVIEPDPAVGPDDLEHALFDQILPLFAQRFGLLSLHGSAVTRGGRAAAFVGASGAGKSTLAFALACSFGFELAGDDGVPLLVEPGHVLLRAASPGSRLWGDSLRATNAPAARDGDTKQRAFAPASEPRAVALAAVLLLEEAEQLTLRPLAPQTGALCVAGHVDRLDPGDARALAWELERLGELALAVPIFELGYPRDFAFDGLAARVAELLG